MLRHSITKGNPLFNEFYSVEYTRYILYTLTGQVQYALISINKLPNIVLKFDSCLLFGVILSTLKP